MIYLIVGLALWSAVHLVPTIGLSVKNGVTERFGPNTYKTVFSVLILLSLGLIVVGWRSSIPYPLYSLPPTVKAIALFLLVIAFLLMGAANYKTRIKQFIRHPQLTGVALWSGAHLLMNGDTRSVLLFGGLGAWAILEILLINRRDGAWIKPDSPSWKVEIRGVIISLVVFAIVILIHPYIAGVPVYL